jgi:hypothetical protein
MEEETNTNKEYYPCITPGCNNLIPWSDRDKGWYVQRGWTTKDGQIIKPKRCKSCREKIKLERYSGEIGKPVSEFTEEDRNIALGRIK